MRQAPAAAAFHPSQRGSEDFHGLVAFRKPQMEQHQPAAAAFQGVSEDFHGLVTLRKPQVSTFGKAPPPQEVR